MHIQSETMDFAPLFQTGCHLNIIGRETDRTFSEIVSLRTCICTTSLPAIHLYLNFAPPSGCFDDCKYVQATDLPSCSKIDQAHRKISCPPGSRQAALALRVVLIYRALAIQSLVCRDKPVIPSFSEFSHSDTSRCMRVLSRREVE